MTEDETPQAIRDEDDKVVDEILAERNAKLGVLEAQIAAQEAGDPEAAKAAATTQAEDQPQREGYPPHVIEPAHMPDDEAAKAAPDPAAQEAEAKEDHQENPLVMGDMDIKMLRLTNGEWIVGQFKVVVDAHGQSALAYYKVFQYSVGRQPQTGQPMVQMAPWPAEGGTLELSEITGTGFLDNGTFNVKVADAYRQMISPIAQANARQADAEAAKKNRANRILNAGARR